MPDRSELDDRVAATLSAGAPGAAAAAVVSALGPALLGYLAAILRSESDAREVFSEVAEEILAAISGFRGESAVKTWSYRIAWRTAMRFRESPERRRGRRLLTEEAAALVEEVRSSTATYLRDDTKAWLARVRAELSFEDQSLLTLRVDRDLSWAEVAQVMGGDDQTAALARLRKRFERIKERLRVEAEREGLLGGDDG